MIFQCHDLVIPLYTAYFWISVAPPLCNDVIFWSGLHSSIAESETTYIDCFDLFLLYQQAWRLPEAPRQVMKILCDVGSSAAAAAAFAWAVGLLRRSAT